MSDRPAEINRQVFGLLLDHCAEGVFAVQRQSMEVVSVNGRLEELTGRSRKALVGRPVAMLFPGDDELSAEERAHQVINRPGLHEDVELCRIDGYSVTVSLTVAHIDPEGTGPVAACLARDTTERRLLERELIAKHVALYAAHAELEKVVKDLESRNQELADKNHQLRVLGARLSQASRRALIGELSAGIAHSLNNPLAALVSTHRQIRKQIEIHASPELREEVDRFLKRGSDVSSRMEQIIHAVQRAHRSGSVSSTPARLRLAAEMDVALALFESRLGNVRVRKSVDSELFGWAPDGDLQHVVWNLIDNALHAMPDGGDLKIDARQEGETVVVGVQDSGTGVSEEGRRTLFEPFISSRPEGSGLGLVTSRRLARQWAGDLVFCPCEKGTRFEIVIPSKETPCHGTVSSS